MILYGADSEGPPSDVAGFVTAALVGADHRAGFERNMRDIQDVVVMESSLARPKS